MSDKIINTFQQRLQLEREMAALGETTTETDLDRQVQALAAGYPSDLLLTVLVKKLDVTNGQLRGGLGKLAALLPKDDALTALRNAAASRRNSAQTRLTAALLMQRFLGQEVPPALMADLHDSDHVVMQSLQEAIDEARTNRYVLLEYVRQLRLESEETAHMVMGLLDRVDTGDQVGLLRLIAQDERPGVAEAAIQRLGGLRDDKGGPLALNALHALQPNLPPALAQQAAQTLRRLRFSGVWADLPSNDGWRGLIGPADPAGNQIIWFVRTPQAEPGDADDGVLIGIHASPLAGVLETFGHERVDATALPIQRQVGQLVSVDTGNRQPLVLLEVPFDFARWRLQAALTAHWQIDPAQPLPEEYQLTSDLLWTLPPPVMAPTISPTLQGFFIPDPDLWAEASGNLNLGTAAERVLQHPAMGTWFFHGQNLLRYMRTRSDLSSTPGIAQMVKGLLHEIFSQDDNDELLAGLEAGLRAQAAWLYLAGSRDSAHQAHVLAESVRNLPPAQNPFLARMMEIGVRFALEHLPS